MYVSAFFVLFFSLHARYTLVLWIWWMGQARSTPQDKLQAVGQLGCSFRGRLYHFSRDHVGVLCSISESETFSVPYFAARCRCFTRRSSCKITWFRLHTPSFYLPSAALSYRTQGAKKSFGYGLVWLRRCGDCNAPFAKIFRRSYHLIISKSRLLRFPAAAPRLILSRSSCDKRFHLHTPGLVFAFGSPQLST
ncbi:hypothetical protein B0H14DRAFT_1603240 [Mycena olivaceomarginata]|nr:hypothetical protein B0H14DRAFT_1603240 [Mycena olivaceomarginata]